MEVPTQPSPTLLVLRCADLDRSRLFYGTVGLDLVEEQHGAGPVHLAATLDAGLVVELYPATGDDLPGRDTVGDVRLGFAVESPAAVVSTLQQLGFPVPAAAPDGTTTIVTDPDDRRVELSAKPRPAP